MENIGELLRELANAKADESEAKGRRIAIEERIVAALDDPPEKGSRTIGDGTLKCSIKFGLKYKADVEKIRALDGVPAEVLPLKETDPVPAGYVLDEKAYEALRESHPDVFAKVAACVETKPSKPSLTLKL